MTLALALVCAFILDLALGDPAWLPHPVVGLGRWIKHLEGMLRRSLTPTARNEAEAGVALVAWTVIPAFFLPYLILALAGLASPYLALALEIILGFQILATRGLAEAGLKVARELARGDLEAARRRVGEIVGRDNQELDASGVARAAVESVAENSSDAVIAPMFYFLLGGAPLAFLYKAVNTLDSMVGHHNPRYEHFGRAAAKLDDWLNFIPARLSGLLVVPAAFLTRQDWRGAWRIFRRDRLRHPSPNSGHPEAAVAGALGLVLGGDASYGGSYTPRPEIGEGRRHLDSDDIILAVKLFLLQSVLGLWLGVLIRLSIASLVFLR
jgi:adenosylcobinamide-phosphate synthase